AEAVLKPVRFAGLPALKKERPAKAYRPAPLDERIRSSRTRVEARLLHRAKMAGVPCPTVLAAGPYSVTMSRMKGKTLHSLDGKNMPDWVWALAGRYLARLHGARIIHGDYTPANLMRDGKSLFVIDFGLGSTSHDIEDYAVDALTMKKSLPAAAAKAFLLGYEKEGKAESRRVLKLVKEVEARARYQDRGAG
ncbi:MAG: Kae1-associated serine/threonine protein kinase, partial [Candidatus Micrarchaeota archaeon]|nr:Kae1-associated serine/threonine protein kinase [Candidatus Micrarchaeota archaeon]